MENEEVQLFKGDQGFLQETPQANKLARWNTASQLMEDSNYSYEQAAAHVGCTVDELIELQEEFDPGEE